MLAWLQALGSPERPVALLVDDLQWADPPVIHALSQGPYPNLLVVGASRASAPPDATHTLELAPLAPGDVDT